MQSLLIKFAQCLKHLSCSKTELRGITTALLPFAGTTGGKFNAQTYIRHHTELLSSLCHDVYLVHLLDDDKDALAHLLRQQSQFHVCLVLVSVTDDKRVALTCRSYHGMQLRL